MVPCGIFETRISANVLYQNNLGSVYYVINLGMHHYKVWKFYIQSKYLPPYLTKYINEFFQLSIFASDDCSKTRKVVNLFLNIAGVYLQLNAAVNSAHKDITLSAFVQKWLFFRKLQ